MKYTSVRQYAFDGDRFALGWFIAGIKYKYDLLFGPAN